MQGKENQQRPPVAGKAGQQPAAALAKRKSGGLKQSTLAFAKKPKAAG